jgi:hypothetical protein
MIALPLRVNDDENLNLLPYFLDCRLLTEAKWNDRYPSVAELEEMKTRRSLMTSVSIAEWTLWMATNWPRLLLAVRLEEHELKVLERRKKLSKFKSVGVMTARAASIVEAAASEDEDVPFGAQDDDEQPQNANKLYVHEAKETMIGDCVECKGDVDGSDSFSGSSSSFVAPNGPQKRSHGDAREKAVEAEDEQIASAALDDSSKTKRLRVPVEESDL